MFVVWFLASCLLPMRVIKKKICCQPGGVWMRASVNVTTAHVVFFGLSAFLGHRPSSMPPAVHIPIQHRILALSSPTPWNQGNPPCNPQNPRHGTDRNSSLLPSWNRYSSTWQAPFVMEAINARIVHRSNALAAEIGGKYGKDFKCEWLREVGWGEGVEWFDAFQGPRRVATSLFTYVALVADRLRVIKVLIILESCGAGIRLH